MVCTLSTLFNRYKMYESRVLVLFYSCWYSALFVYIGADGSSLLGISSHQNGQIKVSSWNEMRVLVQSTLICILYIYCWYSVKFVHWNVVRCRLFGTCSFIYGQILASSCIYSYTVQIYLLTDSTCIINTGTYY